MFSRSNSSCFDSNCAPHDQITLSSQNTRARWVRDLSCDEFFAHSIKQAIACIPKFIAALSELNIFPGIKTIGNQYFLKDIWIVQNLSFSDFQTFPVSIFNFQRFRFRFPLYKANSLSYPPGIDYKAHKRGGGRRRRFTKTLTDDWERCSPCGVPSASTPANWWWCTPQGVPPAKTPARRPRSWITSS